MRAQRGLTIERMVKLGRVSRSGFYRFAEDRPLAPDRDLDLRDSLQRIALEWPSYGRRRITAELRRRGWRVNPKRVYRLMREDNLLCMRKRKFIVTTDSRHGRKVYPNRARQMVLTGVDQLWVADITYIRLREEFVFLAVMLDAYSRRVIGWALDRTLEDELTLAALRMALSHRSLQAGLVHHSDRGSQYASNDYTDLLKAHQIDISMSRKAHPGDNAACESFMKTLKYEEVHTPALRARLLAAGGVRGQPRGPEQTGCRCFMSFFRHREIYPSDGGASVAANAPAHRQIDISMSRKAHPGDNAACESPPERGGG